MSAKSDVNGKKETNLKRNAKRRQWQLLFFAAIAILIVLPVCLIYGYYHSKLKLLDYDDGSVVVSGTISDTDSDVLAENAAMLEAAAGLENTDVVLAEGDILVSENVFNILLIGTDERTEDFSVNARGDSCMLLSINKETMQVHLVSFERGMAMPVLYGQYEDSYDWLTHLFRYGGAELMMESISQSFKLDVRYYVRVNFHTFEQIIDAVGGVDITLTELEAMALNGQVRTNGTSRAWVHEGLNHLDGYDALQYSRQRYIDSDWKRIERQRNVISTVIAEIKEMNIVQIDRLLDAVLPLIRTNLTESEIAELIFLFPRLSEVAIEEMTIPVKGSFGVMEGLGGRALFAPNYQTNAQILREVLYGVKTESDSSEE